MADDKIWYFAFGSNMDPKILSGRRKIFPTKSMPSFIPGWYLNFDTPGIPYFEPSFGSVGRKRLSLSQPEVHGVIHEITRKDFDQIRRNEGGGGHDGVGYSAEEVTVRTYDGKEVKASTLVETGKPAYQLYPSKRYMKLLENGSTQFGLKPDYQEWLKTVPRYEILQSFRHRVGRYLFLGMALFFGLPMLIPFFIRFFVPSSRSPPRWTYVVFKYFMVVLGHVYQIVFRPVFGNGGGEPTISPKSEINGNGNYIKTK